MGNYVIQPGDNLSSIARQHCTTVQHLMELNPEITNQNLIFATDTIKLPAADEFVHENQSTDNSTNITTPIETSEENIFAGNTDSEEIQQQSNNGSPTAAFVGGVVLGAAYAPTIAKTAKTVQKKASTAISAANKKLKYKGLRTVVKSKAAVNAVKTKAQDVVSKSKGAVKTVAAKGKAATKTVATKGAAAAKTGVSALGKSAPSIMKTAGKVAKPLAIAYSAVEIADAYEKGGTTAAVKTAGKTTAAIAGAWAGAKGGAALGAAIGSVVPGVGTAVGGFVGGVIGGCIGWFAGEKIAEKALE